MRKPTGREQGNHGHGPGVERCSCQHGPGAARKTRECQPRSNEVRGPFLVYWTGRGLVQAKILVPPTSRTGPATPPPFSCLKRLGTDGPLECEPQE